MRIVYIKLKGYIGIYNGLGLNEIEIDLSQSKHKIVVLSGINGCGKSTLLRAMSILPDNSSEFVPNMPAEKYIKILDNNNLYDIRITSASAKNGRGISKASILKNGIELNPNGNIGSYKEIIFQEFDLDSNFIALSRLSGDDRGLADKSPAERKKFMSFIVDSLEVYNSIYKNLNKKSSIFKSYVNNLHTKIQNIGDEDNLRGLLITLESQRESLKKSIDEVKKKMTESQTILSLNDPNGVLQSQYEACDNNVKELQKITDSLFKEFKLSCSSIGIEPKVEAVLHFIDQQNSLIETHENNLEESNRKKLSIIERKETLNNYANDTRRKISELESGINLQLKDTIIAVQNKVNAEIQILNSIGVDDPDNTSKEELQYAFDTIKMIVSMIEDQLYYDANEQLMKYVISWDISEFTRLSEKISSSKAELESLTTQLLEAKKDAEIIAILSNRPKACKIDNCYFIGTAYSLKNDKYGGKSITKLIQSLEVSINKLSDTIEGLLIEEENMKIVANKKAILDQIRSIIDRNQGILGKYKFGRDLMSIFEKNISHMISFDQFKDMDSMIDQINTISIYKKDAETLNILKIEWTAQSNTEKMINDLNAELDETLSKILDIEKELSAINNEIFNYNGIINTTKNKLSLANKANEKANAWMNENLRLSEAITQFNEVTKKSKESIAILENISLLTVHQQQYESQIPAIEEKISVCNGQLMMLSQYKEEYEMYSAKYNMIETLKKYSSPTGGIQTLFMSIYMNKTLELANDVLGMIFQGQYRLLDYVINANEFRIPFVGLGLTVDDISSGSTSQVCMMGMVMNLVLLYQASTRYNITRLDEIDGGLDTRNRLEFVNVLYKVIDILGIDQLFIISHSLELELSNVDLILLKTYEDFDYSSSSNILYNFKDQH